MPCRVSFECPCCGQETSANYTLSQAVDRMVGAFERLQEHHKGMDERLEAAEAKRDSAEQANVKAQGKVEQANAQRNAYRTRLAKLESGSRDEWLASFSDDEILDEIARRRTNGGV